MEINYNYLIDTNILIYYFNGLIENEKIVNKTIEIKRKEKIKMPDAIIGATAFIYGFKLLTNNIKDFEKLGLSLSNVNLKI